MRKPRGRHKRCPYFKVQIFNPIAVTWQDHRTAFNTVQDAAKYIEAIAPRKGRVVAVEERGRRILELPSAEQAGVSLP